MSRFFLLNMKYFTQPRRVDSRETRYLMKNRSQTDLVAPGCPLCKFLMQP